MMVNVLRNDRELEEAVKGSKEALDDNNRALAELLNCLHDIGGIGKHRISLLIKKAGDSCGQDHP